MSLSAIAREAGVSVSTVSRFLRGQLSLRPETEQNIKSAIDKLGHVPNKINSKVVSHVGLVLPDLKNPFFSEMAEAAVQSGYENNLQPVITISRGNENREEELLKGLSKMDDVGGILFVSMNKKLASFSNIPYGKPIVAVDEKICMTDGFVPPFVGADNFDGAFQATSYLISQGHSNIAHIAGPKTLESAVLRYEGYKKALQFHGIKYDDNAVIWGEYSASFGAQALGYISQLKPRPSAAFVSSDIVAMGIISAADMYAIRIPQELSIIGFDGIAVGAWLRPALTTVSQPIAQIISHSFAELINLMNGKKAQDHVLSMKLTIRSSVVFKK